MPKWLIYCTTAMLMFAIWSLIAPIAMRDLSAYMVQIVSTIGLIPFAVLLLFSKRLKKATDYKKGILFATGCGVFSAVGNILLYRSLAAGGPPSLVFPLTGMPLLPVIAAPFLFKERISKLQGLGIALALTAIVLLNTVSAPGTSLKETKLVAPWMLFTLLCLLSYGGALTTQKAATYHISDELSTVVYTVAFILVAVFLIITDRTLVWTVPAVPGLISLVIGVLMGIGTLTLYAAFRHGKATVVSPFVQLYPVITVLAAVLVYHEPIGWLKGLGIVFALAAGVLLAIETEPAGQKASTAAAEASSSTRI
jgi:drug/metabolite transporter (DMT)-like permease